MPVVRWHGTARVPGSSPPSHRSEARLVAAIASALGPRARCAWRVAPIGTGCNPPERTDGTCHLVVVRSTSDSAAHHAEHHKDGANRANRMTPIVHKIAILATKPMMMRSIASRVAGPPRVVEFPRAVTALERVL